MHPPTARSRFARRLPAGRLSRCRRLACSLIVATLLAGCAQAQPISEPISGPLSGAVPSPLAGSRSGSAPSPGPDACPASGVRPEAGGVSAAMGLRALGIYLVNCGDRTYRVTGYPALRALDDRRAKLNVRVLNGITEIASLPGWSGRPRPVVLRPGERAEAVVVWRNTYDDVRDPPVDVTYLEVAPLAGRPAGTIAPEGGLDLGSTGRLGVSWWRASPTPTRRSPTASAATPDPASATPPLP